MKVTASIMRFYNKKKVLGGNLDIIRQNNIDFSYNSKDSIFIFAYDNEVKAVLNFKTKLKRMQRRQ